MLVQHLRHPLERIDVRPGFWGLEWSCPSPWEVPEGMLFRDVVSWTQIVCFSMFEYTTPSLHVGFASSSQGEPGRICCSETFVQVLKDFKQLKPQKKK